MRMTYSRVASGRAPGERYSHLRAYFCMDVAVDFVPADFIQPDSRAKWNLGLYFHPCERVSPLWRAVRSSWRCPRMRRPHRA